MRSELKCFRCGKKLKHKEEVWRDKERKPTCEDCIDDDVLDLVDDEWVDMIKDEIEEEYDRNVKKWRSKHILERCPKCDELTWKRKDKEFECSSCGYPDEDIMEEKKVWGNVNK